MRTSLKEKIIFAPFLISIIHIFLVKIRNFFGGLFLLHPVRNEKFSAIYCVTMLSILSKLPYNSWNAILVLLCRFCCKELSPSSLSVFSRFISSQRTRLLFFPLSILAASIKHAFFMYETPQGNSVK